MILTEMAQYIEASGLGTLRLESGGGDIYFEHLPDGVDIPADAICLYSTGGQAADVATSIRRPSVQIIVRGVDLLATMERAQSIHDLFDAKSTYHLISGGTRVMLSRCRQSEPAYIECDDNGRHSYSINVFMIIGGL